MSKLVRVSLIVAALALLFGRAPRAAAEAPVFTVSVKSAYLREQPAFTARRAYSVFQGQGFPVAGRSANDAWVQLVFPGIGAGPTWIYLGYGQLNANVRDLPLVAAAAPAAPVGGQPAPEAAAAPAASAPVHYTVLASSLFARAAPDYQSARVYSLFRGQRYLAVARSADNNWLQLDLGRNLFGWAPAMAGSLQGSLAGLPVGAAADASLPTAEPPAAGPVLPAVSARARDIYQRGLSLGNNPRAFSKVGDCQSVPPFFLAPFDRGEYRLGPPVAYLQTTIDQFAGSFARDSLAARDGMNAASLLDPIWANPRLCQRGETPLACEYRVHRPSLALIGVGTNGAWQSDQEYEANLRRVLDYSIEQGVLPILSTKADNLEGGDRFNQIVRRLAGEYDVPVWDFAAAARPLPSMGLVDAYHLSWGMAYFDNPATLSLGWQVRNLTALQALDAVWSAVR